MNACDLDTAISWYCKWTDAKHLAITANGLACEFLISRKKSRLPATSLLDLEIFSSGGNRHELKRILDDDFFVAELAGLGPGFLGAFADGDHEADDVVVG